MHGEWEEEEKVHITWKWREKMYGKCCCVLFVRLVVKTHEKNCYINTTDQKKNDEEEEEEKWGGGGGIEMGI